jgi:hypothetical protein
LLPPALLVLYLSLLAQESHRRRRHLKLKTLQRAAMRRRRKHLVREVKQILAVRFWTMARGIMSLSFSRRALCVL